jgi:hypothetical protein
MHSILKTEGFVLSIRVSAQKKTIDAGYDVSQITKYVDFINLLTYDFHDSDTDILTEPNAPLGHKTSDSADDQQLNVEFAVNYWIKEGAEPKKLVNECLTLLNFFINFYFIRYLDIRNTVIWKYLYIEFYFTKRMEIQNFRSRECRKFYEISGSSRI